MDHRDEGDPAGNPGQDPVVAAASLAQPHPVVRDGKRGQENQIGLCDGIDAARTVGVGARPVEVQVVQDHREDEVEPTTA